MIKTALLSIGLLAGALAVNVAKADVLSCNSCQPYQHEYKAATAGLGTHLVYDPVNVNLTHWRVLLDRETGGLEVTENEVPASAMEAYLRNLQLAYMPKDGANIGVRLTPNGWSIPTPVSGLTNHLTNPLAGFPNGNAYQAVNHGTMRNQLASAIVSALAGGNTGIASLDNMMATLYSTALSGALPQTSAMTITVTVVWPDGSTNVFTIASNLQATLMPGQSRDVNGNPIPDWTINTDAGTPTYTGRWIFGNQSQINSWVNNLIMFGVPIKNQSGGRLRLQCVRVGDGPLECSYV